MKISLRAKTVLLIILVAVVLSTAGILISNQRFSQIIDDMYRKRANNVSQTVAAVVNTEQVGELRDMVMDIFHATDEKVSSEEWGTPAFDAYIAKFESVEQTEAFQSLREHLRAIQDVNEVDCLYLGTVDKETTTVIYLVDAAYEDACPPGCFDPLYEANKDLLTDPTRGFPPYITNTETYGWLVTAGVPIYAQDGSVICYAMTDIPMEVIRKEQSDYMLMHAGMLAALTLGVCIVAIWLVNRAIIRPINQLSSAAAHYRAGKDDSEMDHLQIRSRDEIQSLYESILLMMQDIRNYIDNLMKTTQELTKTRIKADEMDELAHKDALTGVGSKLAYDQQVEKLTQEMQQGTARFGIVVIDMNDLKSMNDNYGHEQGNAAIRNTCKTICDVFKHSPVYRFGGDEFVVVVKNRDYDNIETLVRQFSDSTKGKDCQPWEKVNAAVGYALYNGEDSVEVVFRRADQIMYEKKKEMKRKR